ncbi:MAG TPA: YqiA/YcfP family alpha/beta fold hydrolase [Moraxellaceae bacterium]|nr:YqiA/YcfP family alpha/beta fold hydrolase [Moraxellaceae bacterium]
MKDLLYIHGFLSSPQSLKARQTEAWVRACHPEARVHVPALPVDPLAALACLESVIRGCSTTPGLTSPGLASPGLSSPGLIGSSLGGFYANILAARHGLRAVLVNPAVHPHRLMGDYVGPQRNHHTGDVCEVTLAHCHQLEQLDVVPPHPERLWVLLETGDETLDYRQATQFYAACHLDVTPGGTHAYEGYVDRLPAIWEFLSKKSV